MNADQIAKLARNIIITENDIKTFEPHPDDAHIVGIEEYQDDALSELRSFETATGDKTPWNYYDNCLRFRPNELTVWGGYSGDRKSFITGQVALDLATQGKKVIIASFEMVPPKTVARIIAQGCANTNPSDSLVAKFFHYITGKLYLYKQINVSTPQRVLRFVRYAIEALKFDHVFLDSLMTCVLTDDTDDIFNFMSQLMAIKNDYGGHIHLVAHMRKQGQGIRVEQPPKPDDILGTSKIRNLVDNILVPWVDKVKKEEAEKPIDHQNPDIMKNPDMYVIVRKQRNFGWEKRIPLDIDDYSLQCIQHNCRRKNYYEYF